jgi:hypothetical protein
MCSLTGCGSDYVPETGILGAFAVWLRYRLQYLHRPKIRVEAYQTTWTAGMSLASGDEPLSPAVGVDETFETGIQEGSTSKSVSLSMTRTLVTQSTRVPRLSPPSPAFCAENLHTIPFGSFSFATGVRL